MYPAVFLMHFISAAVILLVSLALIVQVSLPYNNTGRYSVLYKFILFMKFEFSVFLEIELRNFKLYVLKSYKNIADGT
jgi:hypothetical protein